ncbi:MAG: sulfide/dihydroorotate dehydrogenase-like FAD/NAD-binding protein [Deferribacteraceae bacterium]|jgi:ferredoxin--NADP+ reductase|nr:sulfide/dihydroorotate dehydrogenase-like FAD/NAD-binding protein [Deferribacteraceae bacterium]
MYRIEFKRKLSEFVELMTVRAPNVARRTETGQFVIVSAHEDGERIPLTIVDYNREELTIQIIYQIVGYSTKRLSELNAGDYLPVVLGPLGMPTHYETDGEVKNILGIGGGVGIAPLYPQMKKFKRDGLNVEVLLGGRSKDLVILKEEIAEFADALYFATDDGSLGIQGLVTDRLKSLLTEGKSYDLIVAIGPMVMMRAVVAVTKPLNIPTGVSLNPLMVDGTGMCGCCRVDIGGETKFACVDGPDFDGLKVNFDEVIHRLSFYKEEEHLCRIRGGMQ